MRRNRSDVPRQLVQEFRQERRSSEYRSSFRKVDPLVSVCVGTYNRADLLTQRCLPSILGQTYSNLEVIVIGDACTDETPQRVASIEDDRIRFENLPVRGDYPAEPELRWMVAGTATVNRALALAAGDFITHLDDDDEYVPARIESLLGFMQERQLDLVWHPFDIQSADGSWSVRKADRFEFEQITTSSVFYHRWLARVPWDALAYRYGEPGDWNRFRRFRRLGVRSARFPGVLLRHYGERQNE